MDGFAVRVSDISGPGAQLTTVAHIRAGAERSRDLLPPGHAAPIMTGALLPPGADCVIPIEHTAEQSFGPYTGGAKITVNSAGQQGQFVRDVGSDVARGEVAVAANTPFSPAVAAAAAALGAEPELTSRFKVAVVSTGDEVHSGKIGDANGAALSAALAALDIDTHRACIADDPEHFRVALESIAPTVDLIITTGGVSEGAYEVVRQVLEPLPSAWFGHVGVQPGGPQGVARFDDTPVICLPGNPVSALVSFELFVRPALIDHIRPDLGCRPHGSAQLNHPVESSPLGLLQVRRGTLEPDGTATLQTGARSHLLTQLARSTHLFFIPPQTTKLAIGDTVDWWRIA
jgi:molybdopterin molybdotransferase